MAELEQRINVLNDEVAKLESYQGVLIGGISLLLLVLLAVLWGVINGLFVDVRTSLSTVPLEMLGLLIVIMLILLVIALRHFREKKGSWAGLLLAVIVFLATALAIRLPAWQRTVPVADSSVQVQIKASSLTSGAPLVRQDDCVTLWITQKKDGQNDGDTTITTVHYPNLHVRELLDADGRMIGLGGSAADSLVLDVPQDQLASLMSDLMTASADKQATYLTRDASAGNGTYCQNRPRQP